MSGSAPVTVIETPGFLSAVHKLMSDEERMTLVDHLAVNPTAGILIRGTGGVRKLRWALQGRGKSGGARVIYFYHSTALPLFLLTAYPKSERADLNAAERNEYRRLTKLLVKSYGKERR